MSGKTLEEVQEEAKNQKKALEERQKEVVEKARKERGEIGASRSNSQIVPVPDDARAQIQQAAGAVERAFKDGIVRQTVRFALLGEEEAMSGELNEWPGGSKQMYRGEYGSHFVEHWMNLKQSAFCKRVFNDLQSSLISCVIFSHNHC